MQQHLLVIGGSGMLRECCTQLAHKSLVTVIGRNTNKLNLLEAVSTNIKGLSANYTHFSSFTNTLSPLFQNKTPITTVVAWIHGEVEAIPLSLAKWLAEKDQNIRLFLILGSASAQPDSTEKTIRENLNGLLGIEYREIILGYKREQDHSRWLTHAEISSGAVDAIENDKKHTIIGQTHPWELRP